MKAKTVEFKGKVKITTSVVFIDGMERITKTATIKHRGRTLLMQAVTIDGATLYKRQQMFGEKLVARFMDIPAWIRLGYELQK